MKFHEVSGLRRSTSSTGSRSTSFSICISTSIPIWHSGNCQQLLAKFATLQQVVECNLWRQRPCRTRMWSGLLWVVVNLVNLSSAQSLALRMVARRLAVDGHLYPNHYHDQSHTRQQKFPKYEAYGKGN